MTENEYFQRRPYTWIEIAISCAVMAILGLTIMLAFV